MPTFITEAPVLLLYLTTAVLNECYGEVMAYTALAYSSSTMCMDAHTTPTNDSNYSCHIKAIELI